jgi:hypothetical protein
MGILLFELLCGRSPFKGSNRKELYESILHTNPIPYPKEVTQQHLQEDQLVRLLTQEEIQDILASSSSTTTTINGSGAGTGAGNNNNNNNNESIVNNLENKNTLEHLLDGLLCRNPSQRLGANGIHEIKSHPFFEDVEWDKMLQKTIPPPFKPQLSDNPNENLEKILANSNNNTNSQTNNNNNNNNNPNQISSEPLVNNKNQKITLNANEKQMILPKDPFQPSQSPSFQGFSYNAQDSNNFLSNTVNEETSTTPP